MLQWRICNPLLPREGNSALWSCVNHEFTAAGTARLCLAHLSLLGFLGFLGWHCIHFGAESHSGGAEWGWRVSTPQSALGQALLWLQRPWKRSSVQNVHGHEWREAAFSSRSWLPLWGQIPTALALPWQTQRFICLSPSPAVPAVPVPTTGSRAGNGCLCWLWEGFSLRPLIYIDAHPLAS